MDVDFNPLPQQLLNLNNASAAIKRITKANEQCLLFKLPPEIRTRTYEYALGGQELHIHMAKSPSGVKACPCLASTREDEVFQTFKTTHKAPRYLDQHSNCTTSPANTLSLSLLLVCRALYRETALVPFSSNTFLIQDARRLELFCKGLIPTQQKAIQHLEFISISPLEPPSSPYSFRGKYFTGLRHLRIRVEFIFNTAGREETFGVCSKGLRQLSQGYLTSATVIGYPTRRPATERILRWASELESDLMVSREQREEENEMKNAARAKRKADDEAEQQIKRVDTRSSRGLRALKH